MNDASFAKDDSLDPVLVEQIDDICDRFEAAWQSGEEPDISDFLDNSSEPLRSALLKELLLLELHYRNPSGETLDVERYHKLFPEHIELINSLFSKAKAAGGDVSTPGTVELSVASTQDPNQPEARSDSSISDKQFGRFELMEQLGRGGFGSVHRAHDPQLHRDVALKFPRSGTLIDDEEMQRFLREARAAAQIRHPNIVPVYEAGEINGKYYIASAFVSGNTLRGVNRGRGKPSRRQVAELVAKLAEALHFAHEKGIIHRDVKPENVMIDKAGEPHIMDFGLARRLEGEELLTQEGRTMGTPAYMSPEQAKGESHLADARTDLWALGVILYELLTGQRPFTARGHEIITQIVRDELKPPRKLDSSIPKDLETICLKCLNKQRNERYDSCQQLSEELQRWLRGEPIWARPISKIERTWRWCRCNAIMAALLAAVAAVATLLVFVGILVVGKSEQERHVANLEQLIEAESLVEAKTYLADLKETNKSVYRSAEIQELKSKLEGIQDREKRRKAEWDQHIANARRLGIDEFTWSSTHDAERVLKRARDISATDRERSAVDLLRDKIITFRNQKQSELDPVFSLEFVDFLDKFYARDPSEEYEIEGLITQARGLQAKWPKYQSNFDPFVEKLQSNLETISLLKEEAELAESVTLAVGDRKEFASKLQDYVHNSPLNESRKSDFRKVLANEPTLWQGVELWNELIADWSKLDLTPVEPAAATSLVQQANSLLNDHPGFPSETKLEQLVGYLESVAQQAPTTQELGILYRVLSSREIKGLKMLITTSGKRYYFADNSPKPRFSGSDEWRLTYFKDFSYRNLESVIINELQIANERKGETFDWTSPQSKIATSIADQLRNLQASGNRNATFRSILKRLQDVMRQDPDVQKMEPFLRFLLIKVVLRVAGQGDVYLQAALDQSVQLIENSGVAFDVNWIDPENAEGRQASQKALAAIRSLPPIETAFQTAASKYEALKNPVIGPLHEWVGWLRTDENQKWICARPTEDRLEQSGDLFVIFRTTNSGPAQLVSVGQIRSGLPVIESDASSAALKEGRPVYVRQEIDSNRSAN